MGLLRLLFGHRPQPQRRPKVAPKAHRVEPDHPKKPRRYVSPSGAKPAPRKTSLAHPDPAAPQNVTLPYCRYPKREERAERAKLVYRHACTPGPTILKGRCYVIDGDTISINSVPIRLAGIDAPELDHPYGQASKWAMVRITKGQIITARIAPEMSYDRTVAICCLPDGRDIAAELVKQGLALDWPLFSKGRYRQFEPDGVRRKLWMTNKRQPPVARG
ncbi:MAG: thermonuclease family protein [Boseongicola sp.]|nr:thermonuclease family protein [Boseongicola sp.]